MHQLGKFKEKLSCRLRRLFFARTLSTKKQLIRLAECIDRFVTYVEDSYYGEVKLSNSGQIILLRDLQDEELYYAALVFEPLGRQVMVIVDEDQDFQGICRDVKKFLETEMKYHVYYEQMPIESREGRIAIGTEAIARLNIQYPKKEKQNVH